MNEIVRSSLDLFVCAAREKGIALRSEWAPGTPAVVVGDSTRVRQVLVNLVSNAVKFTEAGSVTIRVSTEQPLAAPADQTLQTILRFDVVDTGAGIGPDKLEAVFESFSQADASTTRRYGGTGLGLAISRRLATMMGGDVGVQSTLAPSPGHGSTFWFSVAVEPAQPAATGDGSATAYPLPAGVSPRPTSRLPQNLRVLLAEDNVVNQKVAVRVLKRLGYDPDVVADGAEAVSAVRDRAAAGHPYDVVFMDVQMPVLDGLEATRRIRSEPLGPSQPWMVALTANAMEGDRERCLAAGCDEYVSKPIRIEDLAAVIRRLHIGQRAVGQS